MHNFKAVATHSGTLAWKVPWTEQPGGLQSMGSQSQTRLSDFTFTSHFHALEKEMATHSSVLAWRVPGTAEPGGLPSVGSHRVGHDWSDLAAAATPVLFVSNTSLGSLKNKQSYKSTSSIITGCAFSYVKMSAPVYNYSQDQIITAQSSTSQKKCQLGVLILFLDNLGKCFATIFLYSRIKGYFCFHSRKRFQFMEEGKAKNKRKSIILSFGIWPTVILGLIRSPSLSITPLKWKPVLKIYVLDGEEYWGNWLLATHPEAILQ